MKISGMLICNSPLQHGHANCFCTLQFYNCCYFLVFPTFLPTGITNIHCITQKRKIGDTQGFCKQLSEIPFLHSPDFIILDYLLGFSPRPYIDHISITALHTDDHLKITPQTPFYLHRTLCSGHQYGHNESLHLRQHFSNIIGTEDIHL